MPFANREDQRACSRRHYQRNRAAFLARARADRPRIKAALRKLINDHLADHHCVDCGESDPIVLEFDHRGDKSFEIGAAVTRVMGLRQVAAEIAKCDVRCANCHRKKTYRERGYSHKG